MLWASIKTDDEHCGVFLNEAAHNDAGQHMPERFFKFDQPAKGAEEDCSSPEIMKVWAAYKNQFAWSEKLLNMDDEQYTPSLEGDEGEERFGYWCHNFYETLYENCDSDPRLASMYWFHILSPDEYEAYFHFKENEKHFKQLIEERGHLWKEKELTEAEGYGSQINWVTKGRTGGVKNQGACGSCYSFAATMVLESQQSIKGGKWKNLSEQWAVDCSTSNQGCSGGWMGNVWHDQQSTTTCTEVEYPYNGKKNTCTASSKCTNTEPKVLGTDYIKGTDNLASAVYNKGPVAVAIDHRVIKNYKTGVVTNCKFVSLTHAVTVVGFVKDKYWLVQNSWGTDWGDKGYVKMKWGNCAAITQYGQLPKIATPTQDTANSKYDKSKAEKSAGVNMCTGLCDGQNTHGCMCTSTCAANGTCCAGFSYAKMCSSKPKPKPTHKAWEVPGTNGWCKTGNSCSAGTTWKSGTTSCSCHYNCVGKKKCCMGAKLTCRSAWEKAKPKSYEVSGTAGWCSQIPGACGKYTLHGGSGKKCSCLKSCYSKKNCCQNIDKNCKGKFYWKSLQEADEEGVNVCAFGQKVIDALTKGKLEADIKSVQ